MSAGFRLGKEVGQRPVAADSKHTQASAACWVNAEVTRFVQNDKSGEESYPTSSLQFSRVFFKRLMN